MSVASVIANLLTLSTIGKSLRVGSVSAGLVDVVVSGDAGNLVSLSPNDGGLLVSNAATSKAVLPVVSASDNGDVLAVVGGAWAKTVPATPGAMSVLQTDYFNSTSLVSNGAGWKKNAGAKWILVTCVGGGASGFNSTQNYPCPGGEGGLLDWLLRPACDYPATADVTVGAGGAQPTSLSSGNYGGASTFGTMLTALGGRPVNPYIAGPDASSYVAQTQGWIRTGRGGSTQGNTKAGATAEDSQLGPGPGGGSTQLTSGSVGGSGGAANVARPSLRAAGGAGAASTTANGAKGADGPIDPFGCGGGGGGSAYTAASGYSAGAGGFPGGGGGSSLWNANQSGPGALAGAGGAGRVCVVQYG